ncbi:uncharacterized protein N7500_009109 [Penicillium coprophilum]|uniref:uncharacterized protein n=1 Tax=Penicillium coprophilum TaxID=36646 RepID=UPI0023840CF2|nr:uncharacterized protein N7500_009109 [Penicillium coprophilum]KAJ5153670.1 hypothetical protein N7500_009109 [Penicillium coprophilum]
MFYQDYLPAAPKYDFKGVEDCLQILSKPSNMKEYVIFTLDERCFLDHFLNSEDQILNKWESYDPSVNQLLIRMASAPHEVAVNAFNGIFRDWNGKGDDNHPLVPTGRGSEWPSIVVEGIWEETREKAADDMRFWLTESEGKVKVALTITVHKRGRLLIEQREMQGACATPVQKIDIVRNPAPNCQKVQGHMPLPFEDIKNHPEMKSDEDFVINAQDMEAMAKQVWLVLC